MPKYELVLLARTISAANATIEATLKNKGMHKQLLKSCATHVLDRNGVVRKFTNLGDRQLPYRMKRHQEIFDQASYFCMEFDSCPKTMITLQKSLKLNEAVIRHTVINMGDSLKAVTNYTEQ